MSTNKTETVLTFVTEALRDAGAVALHEDASPEELNTGINRLNKLLKAENAIGLTIWKQGQEEVTLTDSTVTYNLTNRFLEVDTVFYRSPAGLDSFINRMTRKDYQELSNKSPDSGRPSSYYYHRQREQSVLHLWPTQSSATGSVFVDGKMEVDDIASIDDTLDFPVEWYLAMHYELAVMCCIAFQMPVRPDLFTQSQNKMREARGMDSEYSFRIESAYDTEYIS